MTSRPGSPKVRSDAGRTLSIRLPEELIARIDAAAQERLVSRAFIAEHLISEGLENLIPVEEMRLTKASPPAAAN